MEKSNWERHLKSSQRNQVIVTCTINQSPSAYTMAPAKTLNQLKTAHIAGNLHTDVVLVVGQGGPQSLVKHLFGVLWHC